MTFTSGPWADTPYTQAQWRAIWHAVGNRLLDVGSVVRSTSDRTISWSGAVALIEGEIVVQSGTDVIDIPVPASGNRRWDFMVLQYDPSADNPVSNGVTVQHVGTEGVNPSPPDLTHDEEGIWQMPIFRVGPYGSGPIGSAPADDYRLYPGRMFSAGGRQAGFSHGLHRGDVLFTEDQIYRHDGSTLQAMLNTRRSEVFSSSDNGYPRVVEGFQNQITNSLTVPARDYDRVLQVSAMHYLAMTAPTSANYNSWMKIDGSFVAYWRHPRDWEHSTASTATLTATYNLPAKRSVRILVGFDRVEASGPAAKSSSNRRSNRIDVLAVPA